MELARAPAKRVCGGGLFEIVPNEKVVSETVAFWGMIKGRAGRVVPFLDASFLGREMKRTLKNSDRGKDSFSKAHDETIQLTATLPEVPGYRVQRELGRGAMAIVYEAQQLKLKRLVALKMMGAVEGQSRLTRFQTEAEAVAQLQHPNIVQIFDVGEHQGRPYLALELADRD